MGPNEAQKVLEEAALLGADKLYLISDKALAGSDTYATALTLNKAISAFGPYDIILSGSHTSDGDTGQVPIELAALSRLPFLTQVTSFSIDSDSLFCVVRREEGKKSLYNISLPCVLGMDNFVEGIGHPRYPSLKTMRKAKDVKCERINLASLKLDAIKVGMKGSKTRVIKTEVADWSRNSIRWKSCEDAVAGTIDFLGGGKCP